MKDLNEISNECISKKVENSKINQITTEVKELISFFGDLSYVDLNMTVFLITLKQMNDKTKTFTKELDEEVQRFQNSIWKNSFFLDQLILSQVENHMRQGEYQLSYTLSLKSLKMREQLCENQEDPFMLSPMAYKFKSLVGLKEYGRIIQDFKNIPLSLIELNDRGYQFIISEICSSVAKAYFETNKVDLCVVYQELAVSKIYSIAFDRKHPFVKKEAIILQTYLAKKGDWAAVRTLEERYELKPLPKDAKEK